MRGQTLRTLSGRRNRKRCLLAGLIFASGPSLLAEEPVALAPLPLRPVAESRAAGVENPFCQPVVVSLSDSGFTRLVDDATVGPARRPASQIELASGIEIHIEEAGDVSPTGKTWVPDREAFPPPVKIVGRGGVRANPIAIDASSPPQPSPALPKPALTKPDLPKPIALSFSDSGMLAVEINSTVAPASKTPTELSLSDVAMSLSDVVSESLADDPTEPKLARPTLAARVIPVPRETPATEDREAGGGTIRAAVKLQPFDPPELDDEDSRLVNGGRPRVDVGRPPLVVQRVPRILPADLVPQRTKSEASPVSESPVSESPVTEPLITGSAIVGGPRSESQPNPPVAAARPVADVDLKSAEPSVAVAKTTGTTVGLKLRPREVRALKLGEAIGAVHSGDPRVATAIALGTNGLQVIATGDGATTLTIDLVDAAGQTRRVGYRVEVGDVRSVPADSQPTLVETLSETVRNAFPEARVAVRSEAGRLTVVGSCPDDTTARQVMRMVRSACPVAVDDKLVIR